MRKDEKVALVTFDSSTGLMASVEKVLEPELMPLSCQGNPGYFSKWWRLRAPRQDEVGEPAPFLFRNLGLSLTDPYWIRPQGSDLGWGGVSLWENGGGTHDPGAALGGELPKRWLFTEEGVFLEKGCHSPQQNLNEAFASLVHARQGKKHVSYKIREDKVLCPCFTSASVEFIPAWEVFRKHEPDPERSLLDQWAEAAALEGWDYLQVRSFLDYQTTTDFLLTNIDRHLNNYGLLRDADTLEPISPAPIFDTGNSMFFLGIGIMSWRDLFEWHVSSLYPDERGMMSRVRNCSFVNLDKLPESGEIEVFYRKDPSIAPYAGTIAKYYEFKVNVVRRIQRGMTYAEVEKAVAAYFGDRMERKEVNACWSSI